jgi:hypothetical protein
MCKVVNKYKEPYDIYIGRGSPWGNPFSHKEGTKAQFKVDTREESIEKFRQWLWQQIKLGNIKVEDILNLDGKTLGCFCKPQACHGDVLVKAVEYFKQKELLMK